MSYGCWLVRDLKKHVSDRGFPSYGKTKAELVKMANQADLLGLPTKNTPQQAEQDRENKFKMLLHRLNLPENPICSTVYQWQSGLVGCHNVTYMDIHNYLVKKYNASKSLVKGQALFHSNYVKDIQVIMILLILIIIYF